MLEYRWGINHCAVGGTNGAFSITEFSVSFGCFGAVIMQTEFLQLVLKAYFTWNPVSVEKSVFELVHGMIVMAFALTLLSISLCL